MKTLSLPLSSISRTPIISLPPSSSASNEIEDYHKESDIHEDVVIIFTLPSGEVYQQKVKSGETVQELKRKLYATHGIPTISSSLFFNGVRMMDPLSLNDIDGVVSQKGVAEIEVKLIISA